MKMGDIELSLDDIIKKKFKKTGVIRGRNNVGNMKKPIRRISDPNNRVTKNQNIKNARPPVKNIRGQLPKPNIGDARLKIMQKQRQKITDAREKLGQIAKQTDARIRLVNMRERQRAGRLPVRLDMPLLQRTIQLPLSTLSYDEPMDYSDDPYSSRNYVSDVYDDIYNSSYRSRPGGPALYRTVENDIPHNRLQGVAIIPSRTGLMSEDRRETRGNTPSWDVDEPPIVITKNLKPQETVGILKRSSSVQDSQPVKVIVCSSSASKPKPAARTLSERFCQDGNVSAQNISLLKAKLEASQKNLKSNTTESQSPLGHRIVVSNLVPSVTHEDVKELFEDIGELISSKVVRPGTAEVVYKLHKDAVKAVDVYHNRQLDGQPMKCLLVNNRSVLPVSSKSFKGADRKMGKAVVEVDMTAFRKALHKKSTS